MATIHEVVSILTILPISILAVLYHLVRCFSAAIIPKQFMKKKSIRGQNILITGAGSGVGRALAVELSKFSVCLILVDINKESLLKTEKLLDRRSTAFIYECDVANNKMVYKMADKIKEDVGNVNILINNAGIVQGKYLTESSDEEIKRTMEVNALAHFWTCKAFLPAMMKKYCGHIVSVVSIAGKSGGPQVTDYCSSKFAAIGFAESLEMELRERKLYGIKVTIVLPSHINTGLFEGAKIVVTGSMTPEYVAQEITHGILTEAETVYVPYYVGNGISLKDLVPRWVVSALYEATGLMDSMKYFTGRITNRNGEIDNNSRKMN